MFSIARTSCVTALDLIKVSLLKTKLYGWVSFVGAFILKGHPSDPQLIYGCTVTEMDLFRGSNDHRVTDCCLTNA
ncbi:hypothetical protein TYRP_001922 [Tyrophagus putrescentiae]|nr:hypothetical protein TYRP_001922 [Tyrophagus putrescentiae]